MFAMLFVDKSKADDDVPELLNLSQIGFEFLKVRKI